ncbi:group 1 glycosyl transferase [Anopheles sinensis]|uniref:Group 1 glycosyl transferase n=1 Tax=Anopheles sinensis TaxID=74873 RepID=A0A084WQ27_ANOSI|nr:group 1 glycosyl transferase [Anopheles sinensis]
MLRWFIERNAAAVRQNRATKSTERWREGRSSEATWKMHTWLATMQLGCFPTAGPDGRLWFRWLGSRLLGQSVSTVGTRLTGSRNGVHTFRPVRLVY